MCSFCDIQNAAPINIFSDDEIERIVIGVYSGLITPQSLDLLTYQKVAEKLTNGVYNGFGKTLTDVAWNSPDYTMLNSLRNNVYVFSGAKQYHQVREMVDAIYDKDRIKPFSEYKKTGTEIFKNYNENYLRAEYNAAISQSRSASMWMDIENNKELLPMLEYVTVGDGRVRPEHAMLDKIKRPVDDKFWNNYFPPNGWNCRCTTLQSDDTDKTSLKGFVKPSSVPDVFMMNAGKDKIVFSEKHTYFKVAKQDENLAANNFNMPKPKMEMPKMPEPVKVNEFVPAKDIKEAELWAKNNSKNKFNYIEGEIKTRFGKTDKDFVFNYKHLSLEKANEMNKWLFDSNKICDDLGIPRIRGINPLSSRKYSADMGDGVLRYNKGWGDRPLIPISKWKLGDPLKERPILTGHYLIGDKRDLNTLWHEFGHHIHQNIGVKTLSDLRNPILEQELKQIRISKGIHSSASKYGSTNQVEWFAENYALLKQDRLDLIGDTFKELIKKYNLK